MEKHPRVYDRLAAVPGNVLDIVLLIHPENVLADPALFEDLKRLLASLDTRILE